jgi:hypothetical protein
MSGDLLRRLFHLTRAHLGDRAPLPPIGHDPIGDGTSDGNPRARATVDKEDEVLAGYYANLEIPYGSDLHTVRAAWKRMMKKYHPDLHGEDAQKRQVAGELTAELTRAYQELVTVLERGGNR